MRHVFALTCHISLSSNFRFSAHLSSDLTNSAQPNSAFNSQHGLFGTFACLLSAMFFPEEAFRKTGAGLSASARIVSDCHPVSVCLCLFFQEEVFRKTGAGLSASARVASGCHPVLSVCLCLFFQEKCLERRELGSPPLLIFLIISATYIVSK